MLTCNFIKKKASKTFKQPWCDLTSAISRLLDYNIYLCVSGVKLVYSIWLDHTDRSTFNSPARRVKIILAGLQGSQLGALKKVSHVMHWFLCNEFGRKRKRNRMQESKSTNFNSEKHLTSQYLAVIVGQNMTSRWQLFPVRYCNSLLVK